MALKHTLADTWIRKHLIEVRTARGWSQKDAVENTGLSERTIVRLEGIRIRPDQRRSIDFDTLADVCQGYALNEAETAKLQELRRRSVLAGWWNEYADVLTDVYAEHCEVEEMTEEVHGCSIGVLSGGLQTPEYAEFVQSLTPHYDHPDKRAQLRIERQRRLDSRPVVGRFLLDESVLRRFGRHHDMMRRQLEHLCTVASKPDTEIRYLPFDADAYITSAYEVHTTPFGRLLCTDGSDGETHSDESDVINRYLSQHDKWWRLAVPIEEAKA